MDQQKLADKERIFNQLSAQVARSWQRLNRLEQDVADAEVTVKQSQDYQHDTTTELRQAFSQRAKEIQQLNQEITIFAKDVKRTLLRFRELVKSEQLAELSRRIDHWPLEQFITRESFNRLLHEKINAQLTKPTADSLSQPPLADHQAPQLSNAAITDQEQE